MEGTESAGVSIDKPLMTLACVGVWGLQTLAHWTSESDRWILFMNDIGTPLSSTHPELRFCSILPAGICPACASSTFVKVDLDTHAVVLTVCSEQKWVAFHVHLCSV